MNRRRLLAHVGASSLVSITGCLGTNGTPAGSETETNPPSNESDAETDTTNPETAAIDDQPCPPYKTDRDTAVCSHTVDTDTASVYLDASPEASELDNGEPSDEITLTLHNQSASELTFNPNSWNIYHNAGTEWKELQQKQSGDGMYTISEDETHSWSFMEAVESVEEELELERGLYAAELGVSFDNSDDWIACIALIRLNHSAAGQPGTVEFDINLENRDDTDHSVTLRALHSACPHCQNDDPPCGQPCSEDVLLDTEYELAPDAEESITGMRTAITEDIDTYDVTAKTSDGEEEHRSGLDEDDRDAVENPEAYDFVVSDSTTIEIHITITSSGVLDSTVT